MTILRTRTYDNCHFGLSLDLSDQQLKKLIRVFNSPTDTVDSALGGRTSIAVAQLEGIGSVVIKYYRRGGAIRYLIKQRYLKCGKTRCQIEYELLQKVRSLGINAPEPIAFAYRGRLLYQCWLVTREIKHHQTLARISRSNEERTHIVMKEVIKQVSTLIKNKILHADLHPGNVIVDNQNQVYLLDFDKGGTFPGKKNTLRNQYLRRWNRAVQKHGLPQMLSELMYLTLRNNYISQIPLTAPSILIILMGSLGDVARGLCLVSHIKNNLPGSKVTWLVEPMCAELVGFHPRIDKVIIFNRSRNILGVWDLYKDLLREHFDITIDLQRHFKSGFFSLLSGAKRRIGFNRRNTKEFNWIFNNEYIGYASDELPKLHHYLKFTKQLGLPEPAYLEFGFSFLDERSAEPDIIAKISRPFIAVVMGSSWKSKDWFFEGYYRLVKDILSSKKRRVVLLGDHSQALSAAKLCDKVGSRDLINLVGKTSILELLAVLKAAAAGVGPDSGPGHMAAAVGTPYVTLFGPTSPRRAAPYQCEHLVVQSGVSCVSCYKKKCPNDLDGLCMRLISVESVQEKLSLALGTVGGKKPSCYINPLSL